MVLVFYLQHAALIPMKSWSRLLYGECMGPHSQLCLKNSNSQAWPLSSSRWVWIPALPLPCPFIYVWWFVLGYTYIHPLLGWAFHGIWSIGYCLMLHSQNVMSSFSLARNALCIPMFCLIPREYWAHVPTWQMLFQPFDQRCRLLWVEDALCYGSISCICIYYTCSHFKLPPPASESPEGGCYPGRWVLPHC